MGTEEIFKILEQLITPAYINASEKGFITNETSCAYNPSETIKRYALIITEICEAINEDRKIRLYDEIPIAEKIKAYNCIHLKQSYYKFAFVGSVEDELADVVIRCLSFAGELGKDRLIVQKISVVPQDLLELLFEVITNISILRFSPGSLIDIVITIVVKYCEAKNIDLLFHVKAKMNYNRTRKNLNGKKY